MGLSGPTDGVPAYNGFQFGHPQRVSLLCSQNQMTVVFFTGAAHYSLFGDRWN
jgi:hypothetical protein